MKSRLILFTAAMTLIGLTVGCIVPGHERGRDEQRDDRHDQRPEPGHERDHEEHGHMSGLAH